MHQMEKWKWEKFTEHIINMCAVLQGVSNMMKY